MNLQQINAAGASAAITSPWWLPALHEVSAVAAELAPILGAAWLIVQIIAKVSDIIHKIRKHSASK